MLAAQLIVGGKLELREVAWLKPGEPSVPPLSSPALTALRERPATALRKAAVYAGLQPSGDVEVRPLDEAAAQAVAACLYPSLASSSTADARDALVALGAMLAPHLGLAVLSAAKPKYEAGASFSLKSRKLATAKTPAPIPTPAPAPVPAMASAWSAVADNDHAELMDEDDLLAEEDLKKKEATRSECGPDTGGRRKACKNCSCGLREIQENGDADADAAPPPPKSACGSCGLGDAYRCADCPYLGKPAFKPGEEIKLADSMFGEGAKATETKVATGGGVVVKLDLDDTMDF